MTSRINLLRGWPAPSLLPAALLRAATQRILADEQRYIPGLQYGPDPGDERARRVIAAWLAEFYRSRHEPDLARIVMTGGASQSLGLMLVALTDPLYTRAVWIASPSYFLAFKALEDAGFAAADGRLNPIREDDEGMDVEQLRRRLAECDRVHTTSSSERESFKPRSKYPKLYRHIIYCVPSFSNPSSLTMSDQRRKQLLRVAREHDALIICDDVYDMLHWPAEPSGEAPSVARFRAAHDRVVDVDRILDGGVERAGADGFGNAVSNGSFSKLLGPGVRCGWLEASPKLAFLVSQTGMQKSGGAPSHFTSTYLAELVENGQLTEHITSAVQPEYARRYQVIGEAIQRYLIPLGAELARHDHNTVGGFFLWLHLPATMRAARLAQRALAEENLVIAHGEMFQVPDQKTRRGNDQEAVVFPHDLRLCFAWEDVHKLDEGIKRLAAVMQRELRDQEPAAAYDVAAVSAEANGFA